MKKLILLFWELFKISLFIVGGGYAIIVVADSVFARRGWTKEGELLDRLPVFQMIPGLIATHTAVYVGNKVAGGLGAFVGVAAVALPSIVVFTFVSVGYRVLPLGNPWLNGVFLGLRSALTGIIAATVIRAWTKNLRDGFSYSVMIAAVVAIGLCGVNIALVLVMAMACGIVSVTTQPRPTHAASWLPLLLFLKYGALCFGGGFVLVPMYIEDFVGPTAAFLQITGEEFSDLMALTQMTPGPIGVNGATFFGYRLAGVAGAVLASAALLLPGSVICYLAMRSLDRFGGSWFVRGIMRGVKPASVALMLCALWSFAALTFVKDGHLSVVALILTVLAAVVTIMRKLGVMPIIFLCGLLGAVTAFAT